MDYRLYSHSMRCLHSSGLYAYANVSDDCSLRAADFALTDITESKFFECDVADLHLDDQTKGWDSADFSRTRNLDQIDAHAIHQMSVEAPNARSQVFVQELFFLNRAVQPSNEESPHLLLLKFAYKPPNELRFDAAGRAKVETAEECAAVSNRVGLTCPH